VFVESVPHERWRPPLMRMNPWLLGHRVVTTANPFANVLQRLAVTFAFVARPNGAVRSLKGGDYTGPGGRCN
jgi:hypothetical protein